MSIKYKRGTSNSWLIMSLLVTFYFIYQLVEIYTTATMKCAPLSDFWLAPDQLGINPFSAFILVFTLFGVWSILEITVAQNGGYSDKWFCTISCSLVFVCVIATMTTFRMQWEYYEVQWGVRSFKNFTFEVLKMPEKLYTDPWREFLTKKRCEDPELFRKIKSQADWLNLEKEFLDSGGSFELTEIDS